MAQYKMLCADNLSRCWHCLRLFENNDEAAVLALPDGSRRFVDQTCSEPAIRAASATDWADHAAVPPVSIQ